MTTAAGNKYLHRQWAAAKEKSQGRGGVGSSWCPGAMANRGKCPLACIAGIRIRSHRECVEDFVYVKKIRPTTEKIHGLSGRG
jgi:hypothetical protein